MSARLLSVGRVRVGGGAALARALLIAMTLAVAGCGGGGGSATPTIKPQPSLTPDPHVPVILQAYLDQEVAAHAASSIPDPNYPPLLETTIDPLLSRAQEYIRDEQRKGLVERGDEGTTRHPHVVDLNGTVAVVEDCVYDTAIIVYQSTGQPVPGQPGGTEPGWDGIRSTLQEVSPGVWKVANADSFYGSCPPGY